MLYMGAKGEGEGSSEKYCCWWLMFQFQNQLIPNYVSQKSFSQYHHGQSLSTDQSLNIIDWLTVFTWLWRGLLLRLSKHQSNSSFQTYPQSDDHSIQTIILPKVTLYLQSDKLSLCFWQVRLQSFCLSSHPLIVAFEAGYLLLKLLLFLFHSPVLVSINILVLFCQLVNFCRPTNNL